MPTYKKMPVTEIMITCNHCKHSVWEKNNYGFGRISFGILCIVCNNEGCTKCISDDHFFVDNKKQSHHKTCELTGSLKEFEIKCKRETAERYTYDPEPDPHGR